VWRKIANVSLQSAYSADDRTYHFCRQLLALPYLPHPSIIEVFGELESGATTTKLQQLTQYVKDTWIDSTMWPPAMWSVYCQPVRTNNDAEGWHHRLNSRAHHGGLNMDLLFSLLKYEADMHAINVKLLSDKKVHKRQRKSTVHVHAQLNKYWME